MALDIMARSTSMAFPVKIVDGLLEDGEVSMVKEGQK